jgi:sigma-B regulation protein RsbU (phosphoserine phosphatase)
VVEDAAPAALAGLPLGIFEGHDYAPCQVELRPGDGLVLFSDGVTEARDAQGRPFGVKGCRAVVAGGGFCPREVGERLVGAVKRHSAGGSQQDDITVVCVGRVAPAAGDPAAERPKTALDRPAAPAVC